MFPEGLLKLQIITGEDVPFRATYERIRIIRRVQVERRSFSWRRRRRKGFRLRCFLGSRQLWVKSDACAFCILDPQPDGLAASAHRLDHQHLQAGGTKENIHQREHSPWIKAKLSEQKEQQQQKGWKEKISPSFVRNLAKFVQMGSGLVRTTNSAYRALCLFSILWFSLIWQTLLDSTSQNRSTKESKMGPPKMTWLHQGCQNNRNK